MRVTLPGYNSLRREFLFYLFIFLQTILGGRVLNWLKFHKIDIIA